MLNLIALILFAFFGSALTTLGGLTLVEYGPNPSSRYALAYGLTALAFVAVLASGRTRIDSLFPRWSLREGLGYGALTTGVLCLFFDNYAAASCAFVLCLIVRHQPIRITPPSMRVVDPPSNSTSEPASIRMVGADSSIREVA